eukprot:Nitzschia sp. Nitz4//scaffold21_size171442//66690//68021//NITZ4_002160-RA/size171442-processed-gene-0.48-mRNA-1//-1//CDS//3329542408//3973//frame0
MSEITITLCNPLTGQSESIPVSPSMSIDECLEFARAILGITGDVVLVKDGRLVAGPSLSQAGVANGDLLVVMKPQLPAAPRPTPVPAPAPSGGDLDFSNLFAMANMGGSNTNTNSSSAPAAASGEPHIVYFNGMSFEEAVAHNPHPRSIVKLLQQNQTLFKALNYHRPQLAQKIKDQPYEKAVQIWREDIARASIQSASAVTQNYHKVQDFQRRLRENPDDDEAKAFFDKERKQRLVQQQYFEAMQEYPESMGRVLMLYIEAKINGHSLQAFVDSGAQMTIMSRKCAEKCEILDYVDTRFAGVAVGVGTGKILGKVHIVQLQIGGTYFPCSVTVMDTMAMPEPPAGAKSSSDSQPKPKDMDFLLGLDMLKRHLCNIDLEAGCLKFRLSPGKYLETPFLHEKDLDESKGGTKGFDAEKANRELEEARRKYEENKKKDDSNDMEE